MRIGVPREIKAHEYRVGLTPASVREAVHLGHQVWVECGAGRGAGYSDSDYQRAGGHIAADASEVFSRAELIVKVKEPQAGERLLLGPQHTLFTYLHLAPDPLQAEELRAGGATCIAYETVTASDGSLPLLAPMSEVAGRLAPQMGAAALQRPNGGCGVLLGGVPGVEPGRVLILGGGVVGRNAALIACGMGAEVVVLDRNMAALRRVSELFGHRVRTCRSTREAIEQHLQWAHLVIGGVLIPGAAAPKLVTTADLALMPEGAVIVDVAIDQGGCFASSHPTTHAAPTYCQDGIVHYCVANMPGAVPRTSTQALNNVTLPFVLTLANKGVEAALREDVHFRNGLNVMAGHITSRAVAEALGLPWKTPEELLSVS